MKAQSDYFRRRNSKQGLALSTAMAICIVLAILVAVLVSMASLNITTTQSTVSQREAYITAKSALAFAESYYSQHDIPGKEDTAGGSAVIIFNSAVVSDGARVYVIQDGAASTGVDADSLRNDENTRVYVDVVKSGEFLDLTAHCKYDDGDYYELTREFGLGSDTDVRPNSFNGNVSYQATSDTRYLRIHVRTNPAFGQQPLLWTWYTTVNKTEGENQYGRSSIINKVSGDSNYATVTNGEWNSSTNGPVGNVAMQYEGNGWYVTELTFSTSQDVNFVNAIVTRANAMRSSGNNAQSWEFFGIPVPGQDKAGEGNGLDVYITLNRNELRDARNCDDAGNSTDSNSAKHDEFTHIFEADCGSDINTFAKFCGSWYNVYTKKDISTMHYRKQGVYDDSADPGGSFEYEGYGWWRCSSSNFNNTVAGYTFGQAHTISQNEYGKEVVKEGFICEFDDGSVDLFDSEELANQAFADHLETKAGDYLTVNVKSARQPVDAQVETTIEYASKWDSSTGGSSDPDPDSDPTPTPTPDSKSAKSDLEFKKLESTAWETQYAIIGDPFNDWGRDPGTGEDRVHWYQNIRDYKMNNNGDHTYEIEFEDCAAGNYSFKVMELRHDDGSIDEKDSDGKNGWSYAYPNKDNYVFTVNNTGDTLKIVFHADTKTIDASEESPTGPVDSSQSYAVIGWLNEWGALGYTAPCFEGTDNMEFDEGSQCYIYTTDPTRNVIETGQTCEFKVIKTTGKSGTISADDWNESYGNGTGSAAPNIVYIPPDIDGNSGTFKLQIKFNPKTKEIDVTPYPTGAAGEKFYLIGSNNNWASNHTFNRATSDLYEFESTGTTDNSGRYIYKITPEEAFDPGTYEVKVITARSLKEGADGDSENSINYDISWGEADGEGKTYGSSKSDGSNREGYKFTLNNASRVEFTFAYDPNSTTTSLIGHVTVTSETTRYTKIKFLNAKSKDEDNNDTDFTRWDELYVTYTRASGIPKCVKIEFSEGTKTIDVSIPQDATEFYFSNKNSITDRTTEGYERTQSVEFKTSLLNKIFRPTHLVTDSSSNAPSGKWWLLTYATSRSVDDVTGTGTMVYTGSAQNNYYDAPIVKVLNMLASNGNPNAKFAFAAYRYKNVKVNGRKYNFTSAPSVTYQGEKYYYLAGESYNGYSFLIAKDSNTSFNSAKGGILLENHMALVTDVNGVETKMNNRAGGVFTSDDTYYDGSSSPFNYNGYTPNWYTYKVPVTTEVKIVSIHGVVGNEDIITGSDYFTPANATDYFKQPLYVAQEYKNSTGDEQTERFYTYNTNIGNVDTTTSNKVSVYFANSGSGDAHFDKVAIHAYDPLGNSEDKTINSTDGSDADHNYYRYEFDSGKFCYFIFYDPTTGSSYEDATKKTGILYLTGNEDSDTRAYDILALDGNSTSFSPYIHPKTQALYAYISLESAARAARIPSEYSYNPTSGEYTPTAYFRMNKLEALAATAKDYYEGRSSWSSTDPTAYMDLAKTVNQFVNTLSNARIYIADDVSEATGVVSGGRVYKEGSYRDNTFIYQERWVNRLTSAYDNAVSVFNDGNANQTNADQLRAYMSEINSLINSPILEWNPATVQIIVDDQLTRDEDGNPAGNWGKSNIHLYTCDEHGDNWEVVNYDLLDTTQSNEGFYAYAFKLQLATNNYMIAQSLPADGSDFKQLEQGKRYTFHTATGKFDVDNSIMTYKITDSDITKGTSTGDYNWFDVREGDKSLALQFMYDTEVKYDGVSYKIYAGVYTINATYAGFKTDLEGISTKFGINLFTENARKYFTDPKNYGMSESDSNTYKTWDSDVLNSGTNIDLMVNRINKSSQISAQTSTTKKISFRYKANKDDDTLTLRQKVVLEGGTVTIAANKIDLASYDFTIKAKTVTFLTDTVVVTTNHGTVTVPHGTYSLNETDSGTDFTISLQETGGDPDWRDHYTLISGTPSTLRGGYYITHE